MSPNKADVSVDDDAELIALEQLLRETADDNDEAASKAKLAPSEEKPKVPRLREDSTFADAFSYELDLPAAKLREAEELAAEGLDSSDDEDIKNFLERKYNEYGSDINKKLKQQRETAHETKVAREVDKVLKNTKNESSTANAPACHIKNPHNPIKRQSLVTSNSFQQPVRPQASNPSIVNAPAASSVFTDPVFGLRMINPLVSSSMLVERMAGRKSVPFSGIPFHIERGDLSKDWVIAGALVSKQPVRTSKKGDPYSTWRLSDLRGEIKMISLFLFKDAHKSLWKTAEGMCLAVLNPTIFEKRAGSQDTACLSIDTAQKVMILGQSKDLGMCRAVKRNGDKCTSVVNVSECDYCVFHMKQEYGKLSRRSELQSATAGRGLNELRNKVLGKNEIFYGGQSFAAVPARKSAKLQAKDSQRLSSLSEYAVSPFARSINHTAKPKTLTPTQVPYAARGGAVSKVAGNVEASTKQRIKDLERLKMLRAENERFKKDEDDLQQEKERAKEKEKEQEIATPKTPTSNRASNVSTPTPTTTTPTTPNIVVPEKFKNRAFSFAASGTPKLSNENFSIEVNIGARQALAAKQKAAAILKRKPIEKVYPNSTRGTQTGKRRAIDELHELYATNDAKRQRLDEEQRELERKSRIERIISATSSHTNLIDARTQEAHAEYFDKLEKKEALEEKMLSTYKVPCKAVICQQCKYTAFSASERCKTERHTLKIVDAQKRFFQCKDCGNRTTTVFKLPTLSCSNCKGSRWQRTAMIRERKVATGHEALSIRGEEETFLGSLAGSTNINLLVPDNDENLK